LAGRRGVSIRYAFLLLFSDERASGCFWCDSGWSCANGLIVYGEEAYGADGGLDQELWRAAGGM
jgi:hypothetical protein